MTDPDHGVTAGPVVEIAPTACPSCGHRWPVGHAGHVRVGWQPCTCIPRDEGGRGGHRTYDCLACDAVYYRPPCSTPGRDVSGLGPGR